MGMLNTDSSVPLMKFPMCDKVPEIESNSKILTLTG